MKPELDKFYSFIDEIKIAMMTTRRPDGHLESCAMANQKRAEGADLWFVTAEGSGKLRDIARDPHVNLAYYKAFSYEWVSASGVARLRISSDTRVGSVALKSTRRSIGRTPQPLTRSGVTARLRIFGSLSRCLERLRTS